jgi:hypothetical protein
VVSRSIGFTGTRDGMTRSQYVSVSRLLALLQPTMFNHGACMGADYQAHHAALNCTKAIIQIWPSTIAKTRRTIAAVPGRTVFQGFKPPLERNRYIVHESSLLIAAPRTCDEELRSGTWAAVRYARKCGVPIVFVLPQPGEVPLAP